MIARIEHGPKGANPRFVVTNLAGDGRDLYERLYGARGEMENRIKEQQLQLFADRTSCHRWWPNQFRLLLASLAYTLLNAIRRRGLEGTDMARAQCATIRLKLLKIGAVITRNTPQYKAGALPPVFRLPRAGPLPPGRRPAETRITPDPPAQPGRPDAGNPTGNAGPHPKSAKITRNRPTTTRRRQNLRQKNRSPQRQSRKNTPMPEISPLHEISGLEPILFT